MNKNLFSDNINLYIAAKTASNDFALYKIDVTNLQFGKILITRVITNKKKRLPCF